MQIINGQHALEEKWAALHFSEVKTSTNKQQHVFDVQVYLDDLDPAAVRVELYADGMNGNAPERVEMTRVRQRKNACIYRAKIPAVRAVTDYTARLIPHQSGVAVPLENSHILWCD